MKIVILEIPELSEVQFELVIAISWKGFGCHLKFFFLQFLPIEKMKTCTISYSFHNFAAQGEAISAIVTRISI